MSTYDQTVFANRPTLYLSAPDTTDKSGTGNFALSNNNLSPTGQPIIYGSDASFVMNDANTVEVTGNPLFFSDRAALEFVLVATRPTQEIAIVIDDSEQNAVLISPDGITLKLYFDNLLSTYSKTVTVEIKDWNVKLYVYVIISDTQAYLSVNGKSQVLTYADTVVSSSNLVIGGGSGYSYLIDGIGFYDSTVRNKYEFINDPGSGYLSYVSLKHGGTSTRFNGYTNGYTEQFDLSSFLYDASTNQYILVYYVSQVNEGLDYLIVKSNDEKVSIYYDIDFDDPGEFTEYLMTTSINETTMRFIINADEVDADFKLIVEGVYDGDVLYETPATLTLSGLALYGKPSDSIVNYPDGTKLPEAAYLGTWVVDSPQSIELVFRPEDDTVDTVVFASADGEATFGPGGAVTGYTAYLNGQVVTDLTDIKLNQWNHLVLVDTTPSATEFYLNSDDGLAADTTMSYMLLTAYPEDLSAQDAEDLYNIVIGIDLLEVNDTASIVEGEFESGSAFNVYSYSWAIVGAGGS